MEMFWHGEKKNLYQKSTDALKERFIELLNFSSIFNKSLQETNAKNIHIYKCCIKGD